MPTDGLFPRSLTLLGSEVLFSGLDTAQRTGLGVTNGTSAGTSELSVAPTLSCFPRVSII